MTARSVMLVSPYFPPDIGGVEQYVWNLARLLRTSHDFRVVVVATARNGVKPGRYQGPDGIPVYRLPTIGRVSNTPIGLGWRRAMRRIVAEENVALINAHAPVPLFADAAARACPGLPFVLTYHSGRMRKGHGLSDLACARYERAVLAGTARRAKEIICASDFVVTDLADVFAGLTTTTISPGADLACFTPSPLPAAPRVVFVASLAMATHYKGLSDLLRAIADLLPAIPDLQLEVVGDGEMAQLYRRISNQLGIESQVRFAGRLAGADLAAAYGRARVLALPTYYDNFPTVLVEAMACGRPVVTTPIGAIPSLVVDERNGLLFEPGDIAALSRALAAVLKDDALARRLGEAGRATVSSELSWAMQAERTVAVFERAIVPTTRAGTRAVTQRGCR